MYKHVLKKTPAAAKNNYLNKLYEEYNRKNETDKKQPIKLALFGDFHLDYSYLPGMSTLCD